ncbi:uncharacterized protein EAE98_005321 [Botrytis deweyae]|uniref:Uncharacterized protein n=1 Tax=Botrytis deweyae TaxID=2478750 RepID=A0ABQ7IP20_9HELO|nr:uncharacterized protein EAE98_005321 [Botrytis deweyae]KAF7929403.1 hypothetical protein EAE98_005321 [Botrytis deweyae]
MSHAYDPINTSPQIELTSPTSTSTLRPSPPTQTSSSNLAHSNSAATLLPHEQNYSHFESHFHKPEQSFTTVPYKSKTGKQFWHILLKSLARWLITLVLCIAYLLALRYWNKKGTVTESSKRIFNAITTGISIALGINIATSLKDMALNARWAILHARKRNLYELDLTLHADSLMGLGKLAFVSKRPLVFGMAISWLIFNIFVQAAIAAISLTYGFDTSTESYLFTPGNVIIPNMRHFSNTTNPQFEDEEYTAHAYGGLAWNLGIGSSIDDLPAQGDIYQGLTSNYSIWQDQLNNKMVFVFTESSSSASTQKTGSLSVYTKRTLEMNYSCSSYKVTHFNDTTGYLNTSNPDINPIYISSWAPNATTFFTEGDYLCPDTPRCSVIQALETSDINTQWYYSCNITLSKTLHDEKNISYISDAMSWVSAAAIANTGYTYDTNYQQTSSYPQKTIWGTPMHGNSSLIGSQITAFGLTSLSLAAAFNPSSSYQGLEPHTGFALGINHTYFFLLIVFLIPLVQFVMCFVVAVWSNSVQVGDDAYIGMSLLLRPIADALFGVSGGVDNRAFREAKKRVLVRYERGVDGRWGFAMS